MSKEEAIAQVRSDLRETAIKVEIINRAIEIIDSQEYISKDLVEFEKILCGIAGNDKNLRIFAMKLIYNQIMDAFVGNVSGALKELKAIHMQTVDLLKAIENVIVDLED